MFVLQKAEGNVVVDQPIIGAVLRIERGDRSFLLEALSPCLIKRLLCGNTGCAHIVQLGIEFDDLAGFGIFVLMEARIRSVDRRQRQRFLHKLVGELGKRSVARRTLTGRFRGLGHSKLTEGYQH